MSGTAVEAQKRNPRSYLGNRRIVGGARRGKSWGTKGPSEKNQGGEQFTIAVDAFIHELGGFVEDLLIVMEDQCPGRGLYDSAIHIFILQVSDL